ncbi:MAG: DNA mismatch repair protein MutS [Bacteroidia bacterium]|nr:DNA mismatch repair protein MutS [Bacteroidia bacterium]MDW8133451.1 DNA mismatch repair protein MutS [Bacteroidia bacterium]
MSENTALMEQYKSIKEKNPGAILLFQIGDFYETFEEDARLLSSILGITLTRRNNGRAGDVALAGFPVKALDTYLPKLLEAGYRVAICDQVEPPHKAKKVVRREVTEVVSPGVFWGGEEEQMDGHSAYLAVFWAHKATEAAIVLADVTRTGRIYYYAGSLSQIEGVLTAFQPVESLIYTQQRSLWDNLFPGAARVEELPEWYFDTGNLPSLFAEVYGYEAPKGSIVWESSPQAAVLAALLGYLRSLKQVLLPHLRFPVPLPVGEAFLLPRETLRHLEVLAPLHPEGKSLFQVLCLTVTAAGSRLLRVRLTLPLRERAKIEYRLSQVEAIYAHIESVSVLQDRLRAIGDLERRVARLSARKSSPREIAQLYYSLRAATALWEALPASYQGAPKNSFSDVLRAVELIYDFLILSSEPPYTGEKIGEGKVIREGLSAELDRARYILSHAHEELSRLEEKERARLGIPSLKIQENKQLGYVFCITSTHVNKVPPEYRLRQQLAQGVARYSSDELDKLNAEIASAQEVLAQEEARLYEVLLEQIRVYIPAMQEVAQWVAEVDVDVALALAAHRYGYVRPKFTDKPSITIRKGRHPVIERFLPPHQPYQPNDLVLTPEQRILLLTGPNMAGKSAYMRQNALIILLAQIGSFVPAESACIYPVEQIFSRVGASDNIAAGQSTFLVEMQEAARILHEATPNSFVILDEIGRGTSTYDGLAIAWAILEHLHNDRYCSPWVLFATHYHELTELEKALPRLANFHLAVEQRGDNLVFLHQLRKGAMRRSFGIRVAEKAGLPPSVIQRAQVILKHLEKQEIPPFTSEPTLFNLPADKEGALRRALLEIDPNTITPIQALFKLQELRLLAQGE